jgi:hypothetical protein
MTFVLAINFFTNLYSLFRNYNFHSLTTDELGIGYKIIMESLWLKFRSMVLELMAECETYLVLH